MKLAIFLALISYTMGSPDIPCILNGNACPTSSTCTPTEICQGQCIAVETFPPVIPCSIGDNSPCGTASSCTPTMYCPPTPTSCGGQCIAIPTYPPVIPCSIGDNGPCGTASSCTPTMYCPPAPTSCGGQCIAIPTYPPVISCIIGANDCPSSSFCTPVMVCNGLCISTPSSSPTPETSKSMTITSARPSVSTRSSSPTPALQKSLSITSAQHSASTTSCTEYSANACPSEYSPCCAFLCGHAQAPFAVCQTTSQSGPFVVCDACPTATATTASTSTRSRVFGSTTITGVDVITITEYTC